MGKNDKELERFIKAGLVDSIKIEEKRTVDSIEIENGEGELNAMNRIFAKHARTGVMATTMLGKQGVINSMKGQVQTTQDKIVDLEKQRDSILSQMTTVEVAELERRDHKRLAEECLRTYLAACDSALTQARGQIFAADGNTVEQAIDRARKVWYLLQRARLFVIGPMQYAKLHYAADRYTTEDLAGLGWNSDGSKDTERLLDVYREIGPNVPFPQPLPFESIYLAYGEHVKLSEVQFFSRFQDLHLTRGLGDAWLHGHVLGMIGDQPYAASILALKGPNFNGLPIGLITTYDDGGWYQPMSLDPWVVPGLVEMINEHKKLVVEHPVSFGMKLDHKKQSKKSKVQMPIPKPYYMVTLRDEVIDQTIKRTAVSSRMVSWHHRWDVRGHEWTRVMKGKLPLDPKLEAKLKKRNYRIYILDHIPTEDRERLKKRNVSPPARDEWIAIKSGWKDPYVKGPLDKPYIPAIRKMKE